MFDDYFRNGWSQRDVRAERGVPLVLKHGVASDSQFMTKLQDELAARLLSEKYPP